MLNFNREVGWPNGMLHSNATPESMISPDWRSLDLCLEAFFQLQIIQIRFL